MPMDLSVYRQLFLEESHRRLAELETALTQLREGGGDQETWRTAHRAAHTLKGMAATMQYQELATLAEEMEALLLAVLEGRGERPAQRALEEVPTLVKRFTARLEQI